MGLFDWLFPKKTTTPLDKIPSSEFQLLTGYRPVFHDYYGSVYESALFRSAVESKARHISKLKVELQGEALPKLKTRMKYAPNPWMTWSQFLARCSTILDCTNNLFIVPVMNDRMETIGVFPVLPRKVELREDKKGKLWIRYSFANNQVGAIEFERCAYMVKHQYENDFFGDPNNKCLKPTLDLINVQEQAIKEAVQNSSTIRFIGQVNNFISPEDLALERERFTEYNLKGEKSEMLLFPYQYKDIKQVNIQPFTVDEKQAQLIKENVFNYIGTNENIMQGKASSRELDSFFNSAVEPFAIMMSERMSRMLYTLDMRSYGNHVYVNHNRLQYMTVTEKVNMAQQLGDRGVLTINEIRELFNYEPIENGDVAVIRGEYYTIADKLNSNTGTTETPLETVVEGENNGNQED